MTARILDGKATSAQIRSEVAERVQALAGKGIIPGLAAVLVGDDAASRIYVGQKHKASADVGIRSEQVDLPAYVTEHELLATIRRLNRDPEIHGIIVQLPLPDHLPELDIQRAILPEKELEVVGFRQRHGGCARTDCIWSSGGRDRSSGCPFAVRIWNLCRRFYQQEPWARRDRQHVV